jgi:hypothetical protein
MCAKNGREDLQQAVGGTYLLDHLVCASEQRRGTERPSPLAVLRLINSSYFVGGVSVHRVVQLAGKPILVA